ncbi:hypothetical protein NUI41_003505 [Salmonella enterica subsp. enterica serovar Newport]|nr:hypothetical protein [Salmonella enterica subsp. enterica serovar Nima]ECW5648938.1 hypothetical protein [Salmonella enterica subsp. enterica serovar Newport]EDS7029731.1 hypothetical protein [Salmonella enterica subsp. enterica]EHZ2434211.1 hypothetical protein [Salmonella enterica]EIR7526272.1 hypothetical protein [Salmonella enterica subsp. enterica serovar Brandenburg]
MNIKPSIFNVHIKIHKYQEKAVVWGARIIARTNKTLSKWFEQTSKQLKTGENQEFSGCTIKERKITISSKKINSNLLNNIKGRGKNEMQAWVNDEKKVYLSRVVNQEIDNFCNINNCGFSRHERSQVFTLISKHYNLSLDSSCAQSSINQMVSGDTYFRAKIDKLCQGMSRNEKNSTEYDIVNKLSDKFYQENIYNIELNKLRSEVANFITEARENTAAQIE